MSNTFFEIFFILLLILVNGFFAMSEIALVSARKVRLRQQADGGDAASAKALALAESPSRFLSMGGTSPPLFDSRLARGARLFQNFRGCRTPPQAGPAYFRPSNNACDFPVGHYTIIGGTNCWLCHEYTAPLT